MYSIQSIQFYLTYTKYYVHKVRLILQYYLTKIKEGKNKFDNNVQYLKERKMEGIMIWSFS